MLYPHIYVVLCDDFRGKQEDIGPDFSNIRSAKDYVDFMRLGHEHILRVKLEGLI